MGVALLYPETQESVLAFAVTETMRRKDKDGSEKLTPLEFWEVDDDGGERSDLTEEELADFTKLDLDGDGAISQDELKPWESGRYHTEEAMKKLFEIVDKDNDKHVTADE